MHCATLIFLPAIHPASVYTEMNAISKGVSLGLYKDGKQDGREASRTGSQPYVELMGRRSVPPPKSLPSQTTRIHMELTCLLSPYNGAPPNEHASLSSKPGCT